MGAAAELAHPAFASAAQRGASPGICGGKVRLLHPAYGRFHRDRLRRGGIGFGLCDDITNAVTDEEKIISLRRYHTITESKNGAGAVPIKTNKGWIHIAHGVRNTAAGLRYVLYAFATSLEDPSKVIAEPGGMLLGPLGRKRAGDVSNVVFTNGAIADEDGRVFLYYASSDT